MQRLRPVQDEQGRTAGIEAAADQVLQQRRADRGVLRRALPQAEDALRAVLGDPQGDDHRLPGLLDPVDHDDGEGLGVEPPLRLLELTGAGPNQWTAAEGALKIRETSRVATEGLSVEQFFHGPSVAIDGRDTLVCLDGGGPGAERLAAVAEAAESCGTRVHRFSETTLGEPLSIFPLTVLVQRIALELAEALGTDPDAFGYDVPGRREAWTALTL